ncbi:MAG: hypothetical protein JO170_07875 [Verrucomicrobia bacterium]|nr:hypothetical protein [Verrucomicrobiota bacterium]
MNGLREHFVETLADAINQSARTYETRKFVYCLAINYGSNPTGNCIPVIGLGEASHPLEVNLLSDIPSERDIDLWNPAEFSSFGKSVLQPRSELLCDMEMQLRLLAVEGEDVDLRNICNHVALRLNRANWHPLPITNNFLVYAVDDDLADLERNIVFLKSRLAVPGSSAESGDSTLAF